MKQRKAPIILISVIIIFGVLIALMNQPPRDPNAPNTTEVPVANNTSDVPTPESLAKTEEGGPGGAKAAPGQPDTTKPIRGGQVQDSQKAGGPPAASSKPVTRPKPKPSDSSISGQWYSPEAAKAGK